MGNSNEPQQDIEKLRKRYADLNKQKITAEANLATSTRTLENLKKEAMEKYESDDIESLRNKLKEMKEENERKREGYQKHLTEIEAQLADVEAQHANANKPESQT
jgi:esterase/lipase